MATGRQEDISVEGTQNKVIGRDDNSQLHTHHYHPNQRKLSSLFSKLKEKFENNQSITEISQDLIRYTNPRDTIGLEAKLVQAGKENMIEEYSWLKQEFYKKLLRYQYFEPAQEIFAYILAIVLERYRNHVRPKIQKGEPDDIILACISEHVVQPIVELINEEGCEDIMGLSTTEVEGMFHYLTGNCHIKWTT